MEAKLEIRVQQVSRLRSIRSRRSRLTLFRVLARATVSIMRDCSLHLFIITEVFKVTSNAINTGITSNRAHIEI